MLNLSEKTVQFFTKTNLDYKPQETEYTNNNISLDKLIPRNLIQSFKNNKLENTDHSSINLDSQIMNHPIEINQLKKHSKKKNSNSIISLNLNNEMFTASQKFINKPKNIEFIPDVFNNSSTENKKIMVSDLDISLENSSSKTLRKKQNIMVNHNKDDEDFKKELERKLIAYFKKNKNKIMNNFPTTENRNEINQNFYIENNNNYNNNKIIRKVHTEKKIKIKRRDNNLLLGTPKNDLCLTIMNPSSLKPPTKHKAIYKTGAKVNNNKKYNVYQIEKDNTENKFNSSIKNKNLQRVNSSNLKRKNTKKSLVSNNSLTNCSSTCTHKGSNFHIYYTDLNHVNEEKKNIYKSVVKNQVKHLNNKNKPNQIFKTYSFESDAKEKLSYNPINIINNNKCSNSKAKNNGNLQKEKSNFIKNVNVYDSYIGNRKKKNVLPGKLRKLMSSQSKHKIMTYEKPSKREKNIKTEHKNPNNKYNNKIPITTSSTFKMFYKKINKNTNNKRLNTDNSLIERGKNLSEKYSLLLKQTKMKQKE